MASTSVFCAFLAFCIAFASARTLSASEVSRENLRKLAIANNDLAFNLLRSLSADSSSNVFFSPLSISTAFGMLLYGARGDTAQELRQALGYEKAELLNDQVHDSFSHYFREVLRSENSSDGYVLNSANSILVDKCFQLLDEYRRNIQEWYNASVRDVDFRSEAPKVTKEINDWVKEKTNDKIEKLVDNLSPDTLMVLLNAVYFKGTWETQFHPSKTRNALFYNSGLESKAKEVPLMYMESKLPFYLSEEFRALELPFKGKNVSMLILLPELRDGLQALEESLTHEKLPEIENRLYPCHFQADVSVSFPKFKLEFEKDLSGEMQALGAKKIFSSGADFSGMTSGGSAPVSEVIHKAVIEVNEEGSEAAAVTRMGRARSGRIRKQFKVDHPFLFAIVEKGSTSNMILFLGRVNNL